MDRKTIATWGGIIAVFLFGNVIAGAIQSVSGNTTSDGRSLRWERFDVRIDTINTAANQFDVSEMYELAIDRGPYSFGFAEVPMGRLDNIDNVVVSQDTRALANSCSGVSGTYCVTREGDDLSIRYYFLRSAQSGDRLSIQIDYTAHGALRSYKEGDELFWVALPGDLSGFDVLASRVVVVMPANAPPELVTSYPDTWTQTIEGNTITWGSPPRPSDQGPFEVRVKYPHDPAMKKPSWQGAYDREQQYKDNLQPLVSLLMVVVALALALGGSLWVVIRYLRHGRDPDTVVVPEYLTEPPSDDPPGIVGVLVDEKADMKDIMATFVDLARRGYFVIEQSEEKKLGLFKDTDFEFHRTDKAWSELRGFEETLMKGVFPGQREQTGLSDLKAKFYTSIPAIKQQMYTDLVKAGYFPRSPETTRNLWMGIAIGGLILASLLFWGSRSLTSISTVIFLPPVGLGIMSAAALLFANAMPAKSETGAQRAALWRAFKRYLSNIDQRQDSAAAAEHFEQYMPYSVAFGLEEEFVRQVAPTLTAMPGWYFPTYLGGPYRGGYRGRTANAGGTGDVSPGGPGGLSGLDRSLSEGLNSMSRGMTHMLNEASRVMTSRPQSSGGGRGGFSGGGRGGGSGGGSRGFG